MSNLNESNKAESSHIKTGWVIAILVLIVLVVVGFYFVHFNNGLSVANGDWGTFGDYIGGILNPVIAAFAFYLIAKTYELQKSELKATKRLLKDQTRLAALTALLNSNLTRIGLLKTEIDELFTKNQLKKEDIEFPHSEEIMQYKLGRKSDAIITIRTNNIEINNLIEKNLKLESKIEFFVNE